MARKTKIEPDYLDLGGIEVANVDTCPICGGEGVAEEFVTAPRRASVLVLDTCTCCGGDGSAFPSDIAAYQARHAKLAA